MNHAEIGPAGVPATVDLSTLRPADDVVGRRVGDSAVLIRLTTNRIYELNATGALLWEYVSNRDTNTDAPSLLDRLLEEFDVERDQAESEVVNLVASLRAEGLVVDR